MQYANTTCVQWQCWDTYHAYHVIPYNTMCVRWHICHAKPCNTMYVQWQCWDTYHVYHGKPCNAMCVWWQWWNTNLATALPNWDLGDSSPSPAPTGGWEQISRTLPVSPKYWRPKIINVNCPRLNVCATVTCNIVTKGGIWWLGEKEREEVTGESGCEMWWCESRCEEM